MNRSDANEKVVSFLLTLYSYNTHRGIYKCIDIGKIYFDIHQIYSLTSLHNGVIGFVHPLKDVSGLCLVSSSIYK